MKDFYHQTNYTGTIVSGEIWHCPTIHKKQRLYKSI